MRYHYLPDLLPARRDKLTLSYPGRQPPDKYRARSWWSGMAHAAKPGQFDVMHDRIQDIPLISGAATSTYGRARYAGVPAAIDRLGAVPWRKFTCASTDVKLFDQAGNCALFSSPPLIWKPTQTRGHEQSGARDEMQALHAL